MSLTTEARFAGVWTVTREIEDFAGGPPGRFRGLARITVDGEGMRYAEQGLMTLGEARMTAERVYLWRPDGPTGVSVLFDDGRPFHRFDWGRAEWEDQHQCDEDHYAVRYSFAAESWRAQWRVRGPRKDYLSATQWLRAA